MLTSAQLTGLRHDRTRSSNLGSSGSRPSRCNAQRQTESNLRERSCHRRRPTFKAESGARHTVRHVPAVFPMVEHTLLYKLSNAHKSPRETQTVRPGTYPKRKYTDTEPLTYHLSSVRPTAHTSEPPLTGSSSVQTPTSQRMRRAKRRRWSVRSLRWSSSSGWCSRSYWSSRPCRSRTFNYRVCYHFFSFFYVLLY